jgi:hypothetical protein
MKAPQNIPFHVSGRFFCLSFLCVLFGINAFAQDNEIVPANTQQNPAFKVRAEVLNGDTVPVVDLNTVYVYTEYIFKTQKQRDIWSRIKRDVKVVYPYAILAAAKLKEYDMILGQMPENLRPAYLKVCEKDLRHEFEDELKDLTTNQGRLLMKLIDRESGKTTYEIVKTMRGSFEVVMWQALARLFGNDMKVQYDPIEDIMIERAIKQVESGTLSQLGS